MILAATISALLLAGAQPEPPGAENQTSIEEFTPEMDRAIERGLAYLAAQQQPDGSFGEGRYAENVAVTSLACIALMADGNLPGRGRYAEQVRRGLDFILTNSAENGLIAAQTSHGPMYGHGFSTLFLGEVYGMTGGGGDTDLARRTHEALVEAVRLIEQSQNPDGGWRYNPVPYDADVSVTICQVMALRSARNAGIEVSKEVIDRAVDYVKNCQNPDGGFRYRLDPGASAWPRSAAGVATLFYAGIYEDEAIEPGLAYLRATAMPGQPHARQAHYHYGHYYAVQAMYLAGGDPWARWWPAIRDELVTTQRADGSWEERSVGSTYGTAMSLIVLQMPKRYLPIFQR
ncbi:MAG: prenyltransferase/squalene oxidase repeat-containing protein [Phycisphaerales bacterium JB037]